jgi:hypothetical protein
MQKIECQFPEHLKDGDPAKCSCKQMRICHEKSGGKHPLPTEEQIRKEQEMKSK